MRKKARPRDDDSTDGTDHPAGPSAICLSGGGIRSATFSLGVLQALAKAGWLGQFDYLSTVSGGGYIGSWLTAWRQRVGLSRVLNELGNSRDPAKAPTVRHLRAYGNYLSPRRGLSGDSLALVGSFVRNLFLNWLVLLPLLAIVTALPLAHAALVLAVDGRTVGWGSPLAIVAAVLSGLSIAYAASDVPQGRRHQTSVTRFKALWLLPTILACVFLALVGYAFISRPDIDHGPAGYWVPALLGAFVCGIGSVVGVAARARRSLLNGDGVAPRRSTAAAELRRTLGISGTICSILAGAAAGCLIWSVALGTERLHTALEATGRGPLFDLLFLTLAVPALLLIFQVSTSLYVAFSFRQTADGGREWWGRAGGYSLVAALVWTVWHIVTMWLPMILRFETTAGAGAGVLGGMGLVSVLGGYFGRTGEQDVGDGPKSAWKALSAVTVELAATLFILALLVALSMTWLAVAPEASTAAATAAATGLAAPEKILSPLREGAWWWLAALAGSALVAFAARYFVSSNRFSLQALYARRLTRAYLGASRGSRRPHAFTGFDPDDDLTLASCSHPASSKQPARLQHVVNATLNIGRPTAEQLQWQERKAAPLVFEADRCFAYGDPVQHGCGTKHYGGAAGLTLGRAMAISGAAASPNMGFHTSPLVSFVLAFFNIRLGAWLPNPSKCGQQPDLMSRDEPHWFDLSTLIGELLGRTTSESNFVYVSDGGHFENLGLYEMARRRCRKIFIVDAGGDSEFEYKDLENAIRKIRTDFGFEVRFDDGLPDRDTIRESHHLSVGVIDYGPAEGTGQLIYVKPLLNGDESDDIVRYAVRSAKRGRTFPHHSTGDQFFDETQFESYRALGYHSVPLDTLGTFGDFAPSGLGHAHSTPPSNDSDEPVVTGARFAGLLEAAREAAGDGGKLSKLIAAGLAAAIVPSTAAYYVASQPSAPAERGGQTLVLLPQEIRSMVYGDGNDRIALPLFREASGCSGAASRCDRGARPQTVGLRLLDRLAGKLAYCAAGKPLRLRVKGFSSSSDVMGGPSTFNLDLADERACRATEALRHYLRSPRDGVERAGGELVSLAVASWSTVPETRDEPCGPYLTTRRRVDYSGPQPWTRNYNEQDMKDLEAARVDDIDDIDEPQASFDVAVAQMNRRVEIVAPQGFGQCRVRDLVEAFGKSYASGGVVEAN